MGCPFFARKILKHASKFVQDIVIVVDGNKPGDTVTLVLSLSRPTDSLAKARCAWSMAWTHDGVIAISLPTPDARNSECHLIRAVWAT